MLVEPRCVVNNLEGFVVDLGKIPTTVVTGFLGSGKTTLLRNLLENAAGRRIAVIVNEFGELGIDGEILKGCGLGCDGEGPNGSVYELANGCLCCTVQEEFFPVMQRLVERRESIDHIVIETSGLALPKPLVQAFNWPEIRSSCTVDAVITVVDGPAVAAGLFAADPAAVDAQRRADENLDHEATLHELFEDQLASADLVIVNKTDLLDDADRARVLDLVDREIPAQVKVVQSVQARLDTALLLGLESASELGIDERPDHHSKYHGPSGAPEHNHDVFDSVVVELAETAEAPLLEALEELVRVHAIYRVKGFVAVPGRTMRLVIQGTGRRFDHYFDRLWGSGEPRSTRLVMIGKDLDPASLTARLKSSLQAA